MNADDFRASLVKKKSKYRNIRVAHAGYTFDSKREAREYDRLWLRERAGDIADLTVHPKFELLAAYVNNEGKRVRAITYIADFSYLEKGVLHVVDVKGGKATQTEAFKIKAKLFMSRYPEIVFKVQGREGVNEKISTE